MGKTEEERKAPRPYETYTSKELLRIGMKYWGDNDTQAYIEWCCRRRGATCFKVGLVVGAIGIELARYLLTLLLQ